MKNEILLFATILTFVLASPVSAVEVGFSINGTQSEPIEGINIGFTLTPTSLKQLGGGSGGSDAPFVSSTPTQKDVQPFTPNTTPTSVVITPEPAAHKEVSQVPIERERNNTFYVVCFGIAFAVLIIFICVYTVQKKQKR